MTCVHKRLRTFYSFFSSKQFYRFSYGFSRHPCLSFLKVLLTWSPQIEKRITLCQNDGQFQLDFTGNFDGLSQNLQQLQWRTLKITFFLAVKEFTCEYLLNLSLKMTFLTFNIWGFELNHFPGKNSPSLKSRDSNISQNRFSRFVVFRRTGERRIVIRV